MSQKTCHRRMEFAFRTKAGPLRMASCAIGSFILKAVCRTANSKTKRMKKTVRAFSAFALLATAPGLLQHNLLRGLACVEVPVPCPAMPMYMVWHLRHQQDPAHRWMRGQLEAAMQV